MLSKLRKISSSRILLADSSGLSCLNISCLIICLNIIGQPATALSPKRLIKQPVVCDHNPRTSSTSSNLIATSLTPTNSTATDSTPIPRIKDPLPMTDTIGTEFRDTCIPVENALVDGTYIGTPVENRFIDNSIENPDEEADNFASDDFVQGDRNYGNLNNLDNTVGDVLSTRAIPNFSPSNLSSNLSSNLPIYQNGKGLKGNLQFTQIQLPPGEDSRVPRVRPQPPATPPDVEPQPVPPSQTPPNTTPPENRPEERTPPQLDAQPSESPPSLPQKIEERLQPAVPDYEQRHVRLLNILRLSRNPEMDSELPLIVQIRERISPDLPLEQTQPTPKPPKPPRPFGFFLGQISYFQTDNLFSSPLDRINDGFFYGGLRFVTAPIVLGRQTFLTASVEGNLVKYIGQSEFNYNQFRVGGEIFHRFSRRMYGELGWGNQQLFYARDGEKYAFKAGDRFLNEHSWHFSLGRRDPITSKLVFDSYYELRASFSDPPANRDRIINTLGLGLNYYWLRPLQVGLNYQYYRADFTQRDRDDQYHRIFANLNYRLSDLSNLNLQAGYTLGDSTQNDVDFDGWYLSLTYGWELGRF